MLSVKNISKKFQSKLIVDDVSFDVQPGEIVVLLGQSGVGKSTILRMLCNLESYDHGQLLLHNTSIDFKKVGMVFQDFNLFAHLSVLENLTLPLIHVAKMTPEQAEQQALAFLKEFNMESKAFAYPSALSGGQKQRVALARALCMKPELICMDEPTSALDPQLTFEVARFIEKLAVEKIMVIIATHDLSLLENLSCTIYLMQSGKIVQRATTQELRQNPESFQLISGFIQGKKLF